MGWISTYASVRAHSCEGTSRRFYELFRNFEETTTDWVWRRHRRDITKKDLINPTASKVFAGPELDNDNSHQAWMAITLERAYRRSGEGRGLKYRHTFLNQCLHWTYLWLTSNRNDPDGQGWKLKLFIGLHARCGLCGHTWIRSMYTWQNVRRLESRSREQ